MTKKILISILILLALVPIYLTKISKNYPLKIDLKHRPDFFGVTYSKKFATGIGLDWKETYLAILTDLKVKEIRLPIYWDDIEMQPGVYDFTDYDYMINEGAKNNVKFIVNIGRRLPRWPECHAPEWVKDEPISNAQEDTLSMITVIVNRYKNNSSIVSWQVENEPLLNSFGECPPSDENFLKKEVALVKKLDSRPVLISATGELSFWRQEAKIGDLFGSTVYRVIWDKYFGYVRYILPAWTYRFKAYLAGIKPENRIVIELQAEPWVPQGNMTTISDQEANKSFNIDQFKANLQYAININFSKTYLWGVEWWYYKAKNGDDSYWKLAKTLFN